MRDRKKSHKSSRLLLEHLEQRVLLHAGHGGDSSLTDTIDATTNAATEQLAPIPALSESAAYDSLKSLKLEQGSVGQRSGGGLEYPDFFPTISSLSLDQTSQQGRTLVRFSTWVNNQGNGPAILRSGRINDPIPTDKPIIFDDPNGPQEINGWVNEDGSHNVLQEVYSWNGSSYSKDHYRLAGQVTYHPGHGHFHYDGYAGYALRHKNPDGSVGDYVQRPDGTGAIGAKVGFCLINLSGSFTMEDGSSSTTLPGYGDPGQPGTGCGLLQGIHVGHADIYSSGISGQWLDVTDVPNGDYFIEIDLDNEDVVKESNESNNAKTFPYTLNANPTGGGIDPDQFDDNNENNNSFEDATDMGVLGTFTQTGLTVHWGQDFDYFKFEASSSGEYDITSAGNGDINIYLYDASFEQLDVSTSPSASETVTHDFVKGETYYVMARTYNSSTSSNYQLAWNLKPEASSLTSVPFASENGSIGKFVIARNGPVNTPLTVDFALSGDAVNGVDYELVSNSVTIGNLASEAEIEIVALPNPALENPKSVILTITSDNAYVTGATGSQLTIFDVTPDFDLNGSLGLPDIDMLTQNIVSGPADPSTFDLTGDGLVNTADLDEWLAIAGAANLASGDAYLRGDANLDGLVDEADYSIWKNNRFTANTAWSAGNFNADGFIDGIDLLLWNANRSLPPSPIAAIPTVDLMVSQRESTTPRSRHDATDLALQETDEKEWLLLPIVQR